MAEYALIPTENEIKSIEVMAKNAVDSKFFHNLNGFGGIFSIALYARELGLPPMQCLFGGMHNIQGKIELSARLMNSMIRKAGHRIEIVESSDTKCTLKGVRKDTKEVSSISFSIEDAKRAGIYREGSGWTKWPSDMLFARALSRLARRLFPDIIGTAYIEGELSEDSPKDPPPPISIEMSEEVEEKQTEEIAEEFAKVMKDSDAPEPSKLGGYLEACAKKGKKPVEKVMQDGIDNPTKFLGFYRQWLSINAEKIEESA